MSIEPDTAPPRPETHGGRRAGLVIAGVAFAVFLTLWGTVIAGQRVLVGGDILYRFQPWAGEPGAREPRNTYVGDPVTQFVEWTGLVKDSFARGEMPLWNPYTLSGTPLLANDQSSPFSPFTLLSLLFDPARGISLAMLAKLWVAGFGMAVFVRLHGARAPAAALAGIAYATSSFMVVWLAYPHTAVAALMPWAFAAVAWYLRDRNRLAILAIAAAVALQFLAGHAETSLHLGAGLAVYAVVRVIGLEKHRGRAVVGLATGALLGCLLAGAQLVPFVANLADASILGDRSDDKTGFNHLEWRKIDSWIMPNGEGSPGIDGESGRFPVYPESVGFAGAGAFVLALTAVALVRDRDRRRRWQVLALLAVVGVSGGTIYGPLSPVVGRTPMLDVSNNIRFLTVLCFGVAALAGLGLDRLLTRPPRFERRGLSWVLTGIGSLATAGLGLAVAAVVVRGDTLRNLLPEIDGRIGFWVATGVVAVVAATAFYGARRIGASTSVVTTGFVAVALLEAVLFAWPYNPRVPASQSPPGSATIEWLRANVNGGSVAAPGLELIPNVASAYRLRDPRGVDTLLNPRTRTYWSTADPGFDDSFLYTVLSQPDVRWLAAAGVTHYLTPSDKVLPGTIPAFFGSGTTVAVVPGARPFVYAAPSTIAVSDQDEAAEVMARDPMGPVVVERPGTAEAGGELIPAGPAAIEMLGDRAQVVTVRVTATTPTTLVVLQSFADGWRADIDGKRTRIDPADVLFQSVQVPEGTHTITFRYQPASFRLGMAATAAGLIGVLLIGTLPLLPLPPAGRWRARTSLPPAVN